MSALTSCQQRVAVRTTRSSTRRVMCAPCAAQDKNYGKARGPDAANVPRKTANVPGTRLNVPVPKYAKAIEPLNKTKSNKKPREEDEGGSGGLFGFFKGTKNLGSTPAPQKNTGRVTANIKNTRLTAPIPKAVPPKESSGGFFGLFGARKK